MNKIFAVLLVLLSFYLFNCDLAVDTPLEDTVSDILIQTDSETNDVLSSDIIYTDVQISDIVVEDIITQSCKTDRDCTSEKPHCKDGYCVQCITSEDCGSNEICDEKNECVFQEKVCSKNSDCDLGYICKENKCVEGCVTDKDCPPESKPNNKFCNISSSNPVCVECLSDNDCVNAGLGTKCDEFNICIKITCDPPCKEWEHCTNEGICELNDGACNTDKDCQLIDPATICDLNTHTCIVKPQCSIDQDCDPLCPDCGGYCRNNICECILNCPKKKLCEQCTDTKECEVGLECRGLMGKYCQPPTCSSQNDCGGKYCVGGYCACGM